MEEILKNRFYIIPNFLNDLECKELMAFIDERSTHDISQSVENRFLDQSTNAEIRLMLWNKILPFAGVLGVSGCREVMSLVRYQVDSHSIKPHKDRRISSEKFGVLIYLNDGFPDGRTIFYHNGMKILHKMTPKTGSAVVFHIDTYHQAIKPKGVKYICLLRLI